MLTILPLLSSIFVLFLGLLVWGKNYKSKMHVIFGLICLSISIWMLGTYKMFSTNIPMEILHWDRFLYIGVIFIPILMYHFSLIFSGCEEKNKLSRNLGYLTSFIFLVLSRTNYFINDVFQYSWGAHARAQFLHHLFLLTFAIYLTSFFVVIFKFYKKTNNPIKKNQAKYLFLAFFVLAFASIEFLPAYGVGVFPIFYLLGVVFTIITAYSIVAHHLMDIKLVLRRSFAYLAPLITVLIGYTIIQYLINLYLPEWVSIANVIIFIFSILAFIPLKNFYYRLANKYFFSSLYDSQEVLSGLSDKLRSSLDTKIICNLVSKTLIDAFRVKAIGILIFNEKKNKYLVECNHGFQIKEQAEFSNDKLLQADFAKENKILIVEEIRNNLDYKNAKKTIDLLNILGVEILAPLNIKDEMVGLIALSEKESGDMYNKEDLEILRVAGAQTAVALKNSLLYQESQAFAEKLKKEVKLATHDLRIANEHLKQLDRAKTEFISITSHQLRTPLTGIKGYLSMFLEGDFGKLKKEQEEVMLDVFNNSNRLVRLVNIFLNVSRIESGRLKLQ
ncbi:MAG: histidine kinase dimerization/phospho-acceptor domain-containing protein, partial [Patescibacteria group bacterium]